MCQNVFVNENENIVYTSNAKKNKDFNKHKTDFNQRLYKMNMLVEKFNMTKPPGSSFQWFEVYEEIKENQ